MKTRGDSRPPWGVVRIETAGPGDYESLPEPKAFLLKASSNWNSSHNGQAGLRAEPKRSRLQASPSWNLSCSDQARSLADPKRSRLEAALSWKGSRSGRAGSIRDHKLSHWRAKQGPLRTQNCEALQEMTARGQIQAPPDPPGASDRHPQRFFNVF